MRVLGIDPGLTHTGIGVIEKNGVKLVKVYHSVISSASDVNLPIRLAKIHDGVSSVISEFKPTSVAIESVFVNSNPRASLTLGMARGVAICAAALYGLNVSEYSPNLVKKTIVGNGHADKSQVAKMVQLLLGCDVVKNDAADALAIAICHTHHIGAFYGYQ